MSFSKRQQASGALGIGVVKALLKHIGERDKYGCLVSQLPAELRQRNERIYKDAMEKARAAGWAGEHELQDDKKGAVYRFYMEHKVDETRHSDNKPNELLPISCIVIKTNRTIL